MIDIIRLNIAKYRKLIPPISFNETSGARFQPIVGQRVAAGLRILRPRLERLMNCAACIQV